MSEWGGQVVDITFTQDVNSTDMARAINQIETTSSIRLKSLRRMLSEEIPRFLDIHNGLSALIIEKASHVEEGMVKEFDGMGKSLTNFYCKGKSDIEAMITSGWKR